jgi:hypothetical protein
MTKIKNKESKTRNNTVELNYKIETYNNRKKTKNERNYQSN